MGGLKNIYEDLNFVAYMKHMQIMRTFFIANFSV